MLLKEDREKILDRFFNRFIDKDLTIILTGSIITDFIIKKAKIVMSNKTLMITDSNKKELILCLDDVSNVNIQNAITFEFDMQTISIDC